MVHALTPRAEPAGPLAGLGILVTRPARQAGGFAQKVAALGGTPVIFPAIVILPPADPRAARARARGARRTTTSRSSFPPTPSSTARPIRRRWPARLVALAPGPGTAEALAAVGIAGARIPATTFDSEGLLALPELSDVRGKRIADLSRRRRARAAGRHAVARAAPPSTTSRAIAGRSPKAARPGSPRRFAKAGSTRSRSRRAKGSTTCGRSPTTRRAPRGARCPTFVPHPRIAAHARDLGLSVVETAGGDAGLDRGVARMGRRATPNEELIPCRPTSSSPHRCRLFSTSR